MRKTDLYLTEELLVRECASLRVQDVYLIDGDGVTLASAFLPSHLESKGHETKAPPKEVQDMKSRGPEEMASLASVWSRIAS